jgi:hypothetical protein
MIKVKLPNLDKGKNQYTFRPLLIYSKILPYFGIQLTQDESYDYEFIGTADFLNKRIPLEESIKYGLDNLSKKEGKYFLFDGSDSTSLMASYEVFKESNAIYLFKTALTPREQYNIPSAFNKWFFGSGSDLDLSYDIPQNTYDRIKLSGWNFGHYNPHYHTNLVKSNNVKDVDVCAIYMGNHPENYDHGARNDTMYTDHRTKAWEVLKTSKDIYYEINKRPFPEYADILKRSKCALSPFGMGEVCFRDFEIIQAGSVLLKPDMSNVKTYPNIYIPYETYIPCNLDYSDLIEKIEWIMDNPLKCSEIIRNAQELVKKLYTPENLALYWKNLLVNLPL